MYKLCQHVTLHYIQSGTKSGQGSEFGTIQRPERHRKTAVKIRDCPEKIGTDGHWSPYVMCAYKSISTLQSAYFMHQLYAMTPLC